MSAKPQEIRSAAMTLLALGVVFGDIGMSRNVVPGPHCLNFPADHLIVYTWLLRL
jgi:hypothetical protein